MARRKTSTNALVLDQPQRCPVIVTECRAEIITWFLTYASLKYALQSFHDYLQPGTETPDPKCPTVASAPGVTLQYMQATYPGLF